MSTSTQAHSEARALESFSLQGWIEANRERMLPPITNETIFKGNDNFIVMVAAGPNPRKDFHYNESEELFLQLKGPLELGVVIDGRHETRTVEEGGMLLMPPRVPHQPRREQDTYGLIVEKHRVRTDRDGFLWYCDRCAKEVFSVYFLLEDIVRQQPVLQRLYYDSVENRTCGACGHVNAPPPDWEQMIARVEDENPYAATSGAAIKGRSW